MPERTIDLGQLPALAELRSDLLDAFDRCEREEARSEPALRRARSRWTARWFRRPAVAIIAGVAAGGAGIALAATLGAGHAISPDEWVGGRRAVPEQDVAATQSSRFSILRRAQTASDTVPSQAKALVANSTFTGANGANLLLARRAKGLATGSAWVVPGAGNICLIALSGTDSGIACGGTRTVVAEGLLTTSMGRARPNAVFAAGIVPDGVPSVTANSSDGDTVAIPVHENVFVATLYGSGHLSFAGPRGPVDMGAFETLTAFNARKCHDHPGACIQSAKRRAAEGHNR